MVVSTTDGKVIHIADVLWDEPATTDVKPEQIVVIDTRRCSR